MIFKPSWPGLAAIHDFRDTKTWMPGTRPGMTSSEVPLSHFSFI